MLLPNVYSYAAQAPSTCMRACGGVQAWSGVKWDGVEVHARSCSCAVRVRYMIMSAAGTPGPPGRVLHVPATHSCTADPLYPSQLQAGPSSVRLACGRALGTAATNEQCLLLRQDLCWDLEPVHVVLLGAAIESLVLLARLPV